MWVRVDAGSGCAHTLLLLLYSGADPTAHDHQQRAPLHVAVQRGHLLLVQLLQHWLQPEDVAHMDVDGYNALHVAAAAGDVDVLASLLPDVRPPPPRSSLCCPALPEADGVDCDGALCATTVDTP